MSKIIPAILLWTLLASGCTKVISSAVLQKVNSVITFEMLKNDPTAFKGQMVLLAGVIVKTTNKPQGAVLEIYQTKMDWEKRPVETDVSKGRFLVQCANFLDPEIYSQGRKVTVAGIVAGKELKKLGQMEYPYPVLNAVEIHLWKKTNPVQFDPYPWYPIGVPWRYWGVGYPFFPWWY